MSSFKEDVKKIKQFINEQWEKSEMIKRVAEILPDVNAKIYSDIISKLPYSQNTEGVYAGISFKVVAKRIIKSGIRFEFYFESKLKIHSFVDVPFEVLQLKQDDCKEILEFFELNLLKRLLDKKLQNGENNG